MLFEILIVHIFVLVIIVLSFIFLFWLQSASLFELSLSPFNLFFLQLSIIVLVLVCLFIHRHVISLAIWVLLLDAIIFVLGIFINLVSGKLALNHLSLLVVMNEFVCFAHVLIIWAFLLIVLLVFNVIRDHLRLFDLLLVFILVLMLSLLLFLLLSLLLILSLLELLGHFKEKICATSISLTNLVLVILRSLVLFVLWLLLLVLHGFIFALEVRLVFVIFFILVLFLIFGLNLVVLEDSLVRFLLHIINIFVSVVFLRIVLFFISTLIFRELRIDFIRVFFFSL